MNNELESIREGLMIDLMNIFRNFIIDIKITKRGIEDGCIHYRFTFNVEYDNVKFSFDSFFYLPVKNLSFIYGDLKFHSMMILANELKKRGLMQ